MKNAETPVVKVVLYGAMSSLGSALMAELLRRQHEVIAILDDLTALAPRLGFAHQKWRPVRCRAGQSKRSEHLGGDLPAGRAGVAVQRRSPSNAPSCSARLNRCWRWMRWSMACNWPNVSRLFLVGDFAVLDEPELDDRLQRHAAEEIREALQSSPLQWTLVNAPHGVAGLTIEHFSQVGGNLELALAEPLERLNRVAVGIADELRLNLHVGEDVNFVAASA